MTLRVLTLSTLFPDSGRPTFGGFVERQTQALAACEETEVRVVAPLGLPIWPLRMVGHYPSLASLPDQEIRNGLHVTRTHFRHWPRTSGRYDARAMAKSLLPILTGIRQDFPFDVIDAEFFFPDGPAAILIGKALQVPVSIKARGSDIAYWAREPSASDQIQNAAQQADGLLAVSAALKSDMIALGMPEEKIAVHYTGVDQSLFKPIDRAAKKASRGISTSLIVAVGTLNANKGHALTIEALTALPGVQLVLCGKGPDEASLRALATGMGVADRVIFTGAIPPSDVAHWVAAADVMVLPSAAEGLANAWVEALSCGTPVVACDVGGVREVITSAEQGQLVARTPLAIAEGIRKILVDPPEQASLRQSVSHFTWARNAESLRAHLSALVRRAR